MKSHSLSNQHPPTLGRLIPEIKLPGDIARKTVTGITLDSRQVSQNNLFIALKGHRTDGRDYIPEAIERGAAAVFVQGDDDQQTQLLANEHDVPTVLVHELPGRVSEMAAICFGRPSAQMKVIGVTGTNGKSTCVSLIAQLAEQLAVKSATVGTLGVGVDGALHDLGMTTPDAVTCQRVLSALYRQGVELTAMEISSHGLDQHRVAAIEFTAGVFTNLSHDHLDYHKSLHHYAAAKQKLFDSFGLNSAIINLDDPFAAQMVEAAKQRADVLTYSLLHFVADVFAEEVQYSADGVHFHLRSPWGNATVASPLLGEFNVYNLLAALAALASQGFDFEQLITAVPHINPVPGRMQKVSGDDLMVVVDYAHTPDALAHAIAATRVHTSGDLWVVFGCGGDRDRTKRAVMARTAENYADHVVVTSDNPRTESPDSIIAEICLGFVGGAYHSLVDREEAVHFAVQSAQPGDVILLAGKGHENYQIIGDKKLPFCDVDVAEQALRARREARVAGEAL